MPTRRFLRGLPPKGPIDRAGMRKPGESSVAPQGVPATNFGPSALVVFQALVVAHLPPLLDFARIEPLVASKKQLCWDRGKPLNRFLEGAVKIDVEPAGRARMICVVLKSNIDKYQYNETQLLTEAIFD